MSTKQDTATARPTIKTILHKYEFDTNNRAGAEGYRQLCEKLTGLGLKVFDCLATPQDSSLHALQEGEIELETQWVFDNQWNAAPQPGHAKGWRLFDWYEPIFNFNNPRHRRGYWLEPTAEMQQLRQQTWRCGYCGKHYRAAEGPLPANGFCEACLGSEYLKESDLFLLRLKPAANKWDHKHPPLTDAERAELLPRYVEQQLYWAKQRDAAAIERDRARAEKDRAENTAKYQQQLARVENEYHGRLWLLDRGLNLSNVIFYNHTGRFCFGWRKKLEGEVLSQLLDILVEFPYPYDLETVEGKKSAER